MSHVQHSLSAAGFKIFLSNAAGVLTSHINKEIGGIIKYNGDTPPVFATPQVIAPEVIEWLVMLYDKAFEISGVSKMAAQQLKPEGLDSKVAIRAFDDLGDARFKGFSERLEDFTIEAADRHLELARDINERLEANGASGAPGPQHFEAIASGSAGLKRLKWSEVNMQRDEYVLQVFAESALPKTPSARMQTVQEMMQANLMTADEGRRALDLGGDVRQEQQLLDAQRSLALKQCSDMLHGRAASPDPLQDLVTARTVATAYVALAQCKGIPEKRIQLLREFVQQIDGIQQLAAQQAAANPPPPTPPGNGMAVPTPLPQSPMLPQGAQQAA